MPSLFDLYNRNKRDIDKIVDTTFFRLMEDTSLVNRIAPLQSYTLRELLMMKFNHSKPTIGRIIAEGQEVPRTRARAVLTEELLTSCKIGKAYGFTDKDYEMMYKMDLYLQSNGGSQIAAEIERYFFGIFADIAPGIVDRLTMMMFRVMTTGSCVFQDPVTSAQVSLSYPDIDTELLPAALSGNDLWTATTTANGLLRLQQLSRSFYLKFGKYPDNLIMRQLNLWELMAQDSTKTAALLQVGGNGVTSTDRSGTTVGEAQAIDLIKLWTGIPNVEFFDAVYSDENAAGVVTILPYLDDGFVVMADNGLFERSIVPTVENDMAAGVYAVVEEKSKIPKREQLAGVANGIPTCFDARKICALKVSNATFATGTIVA